MAAEKKAEKDELKSLRKENHDLREDNRVLKELLDVLKDLPSQTAAPAAPKGKKIKLNKAHPNIILTDRSLATGAKPQAG